MEYCPTVFVSTERDFSMSAGLEASTVTPGSTAPEASLTMPTIDAWANAIAGMPRSATRTRTTTAFTLRSIVTLRRAVDAGDCRELYARSCCREGQNRCRLDGIRLCRR